MLCWSTIGQQSAEHHVVPYIVQTYNDNMGLTKRPLRDGYVSPPKKWVLLSKNA